MSSVRARVTLGVIAAWTLIAVVWGAQNALGASLQGNTITLVSAVRTALIQSLPWIPATLLILYLVARFPVTRATWRRRLPIHAAAVVLVALLVNTLVVIGFWSLQRRFDGVGILLREGARWAAVRMHVVALIYVGLAGGAQAVLYYRDARARELRLARMEGQLTRARLDALNAQIRPHFLFNTLHTIGQLWRSGRQHEADAMLDHLGVLFHRVQETSTRAQVPLEEELEMVEEYLSIERVRFRDRLQTRINATTDALSCMIPPLLLQPLVENAVRHGISARSSAGLIEIDAYLSDGALIITVTDDGPGFNAYARSEEARGAVSAAARAAASAEPRGAVSTEVRGAAPYSGTGLRNTRERLDELYGQTAALETGATAAGGAVVRILIGGVTDRRQATAPASGASDA
jgi:two-component system, LytTR family, sensor kinase